MIEDIKIAILVALQIVGTAFAIILFIALCVYFAMILAAGAKLLSQFLNL